MYNTTKQFGFLSKHHIRQPSEFDTVFKRGKRLVDACFAFCYLGTERSHPRLGMVVSKRNCPLAVDRNGIKRAIREQFRFNRHALSHIDLVVMLRSSPKKMSNQELRSCLEKLFSLLITRCDGSSSN